MSMKKTLLASVCLALAAPMMVESAQNGVAYNNIMNSVINDVREAINIINAMHDWIESEELGEDGFANFIGKMAITAYNAYPNSLLYKHEGRWDFHSNMRWHHRDALERFSELLYDIYDKAKDERAPNFASLSNVISKVRTILGKLNSSKTTIRGLGIMNQRIASCAEDAFDELYRCLKDRTSMIYEGIEDLTSDPYIAGLWSTEGKELTDTFQNRFREGIKDECVYVDYRFLA